MSEFTPRLLPHEESTVALGEQLAWAILETGVAHQGLLIELIGDLGAGKTTLVRGVLRGLGYNGRVKSPTYPLLETYRVGELMVAHFDLYRLESPEAFLEAGFDESFAGPGIRFVEWPAQAGPHLPPADWALTLTESPSGGRALSITASSPAGATLLAHLGL